MKAAPILHAWAALLVMLALTVGASFAPLGAVLPAVSYGIALAKVLVIAWVFMELRAARGLPRLAFAVGFVWAAFLLVLVASDALTRGRM